MSFAESPKKSYSDTRKRTGADYVKFTPDHKITLRILNTNARTVWKHFVQEANGGRGMGFVCPNVSAQLQVCPLEKTLVGLNRDDPEDAKVISNTRARRRYVVNVLDRTAHAHCPSCDTLSAGKVCTSCGESLKGAKFSPLNKVKILEAGPRLMDQGLNAVEKMQREDFDVEITAYDINFITQGVGRDRVINPVPLEPKPLEEDALLDPETGESQAIYDLDLLGEPPSLEEIDLILAGGGIAEINELRGIPA